MGKVRCGVIGVGYFGRFHGQKYKALPETELVGIVDTDHDRANAIAEELGCTPYYSLDDLLGKVDAVSIAVPTKYHFETAKICLENDIHVLIEKPITSTLDEAESLIQLAQARNLILQVGLLERFNAVHIALKDVLTRPLFIESHRLSKYNPRGTDVNVVLDLMIHDIDLIQNIVGAPIVHMDANGAPVLSNFIDIANARIQFDNGCVANVTASRISLKNERKMRIFQPDAYLSLDLQERKLFVNRTTDVEMFPGIPDITYDERSFEKDDGIMEEIKAFINSIQNDTPPVVDGNEGKKALATAIQMTEMMRSNLNNLAKQYGERSEIL